MFSGLIETIGSVGRIAPRAGGARLDLQARWPDGSPPAVGDSVAVNGACLTAVEVTPVGFAADLSRETLDRTLLGELRAGSRVNLERALRVGDRLGGHFVQGHVDGIVQVISIRPEGDFARWRLSLPSAQRAELALKGSIAVHGVSLTVADLGEDWFEVALIPATLAATVLGDVRRGARLHLETDVLAKYVSSRLEPVGQDRSVWETFLGGGRRASD